MAGVFEVDDVFSVSFAMETASCSARVVPELTTDSAMLWLTRSSVCSDPDKGLAKDSRIDRLNCDFSNPAPRHSKTRPLLGNMVSAI